MQGPLSVSTRQLDIIKKIEVHVFFFKKTFNVQWMNSDNRSLFDKINEVLL
jgi:hypothetical protein